MKKISDAKVPIEVKPMESEKPTHPRFPIVGIGASAGGLEAMEQFFENTPKDNGMAFVVIQHLDPNHKGILPELLQRTTEMKVIQVTDHLEVLPNHIYVIPPNKTMSILKGHLFLFDPIETRGLRLPIDHFFTSLADDQQENSIGIILSGMGSDGTLGLKSIKEKNGIAMVQNPLAAKFDGMPQSAMNAVDVDCVAQANELPTKLMALRKPSERKIQQPKIDEKSTTDLEKIILLLRSQTGHDFSLYKKNTLFRRIERRMGIHQVSKIASYVRFLQENPKELDILFKELLIGVTNFFRDPPVWEKLKEEILPELLHQLPDKYSFRVWIVGCSTGEEAYTFAMIFHEALEKMRGAKKFTLQIFATDIDSDAIELARKGLYGSNSVADILPERVKQFFTLEGDTYRVNKTIREMVVFAPHNVTKDPPFTKLDFLSCRNLLIYLEPELQKNMMNLFHYSLNSGGIMLLGSAENENSQNMQFVTVDPKLKIYKRTSNTKNNNLLGFPSSFSHSKKNSMENIRPIKAPQNIQILADQLILQNFAPPTVLINHDGDILYITGRTGTYLEPAAGKANMNIYSMAREGLRNVLPGAIRKAKENFEPVKLQNIKISIEANIQRVNVTLQHIEKPETIKGMILVVFDNAAIPSKSTRRKSKTEEQNSALDKQELELELQRVNNELQSTRDEMQTTQEELKSTNEEMQSTNEELQSTNEELTTSKEEMQSLNEELQTLNIELQSKITDYVAANNDMKNLLNSTDIATLFLDKELNIRRFTEQVTKLFKLRQTDIGRPFTDLVTDLVYPEMTYDAQEVLRTLMFKETDITTHDKRWFTVRIMPYRTFDDRIDGLVITLIDITKAKKLEAELDKTIGVLREHNLLSNG